MERGMNGQRTKGVVRCEGILLAGPGQSADQPRPRVFGGVERHEIVNISRGAGLLENGSGRATQPTSLTTHRAADDPTTRQTTETRHGTLRDIPAPGRLRPRWPT